MITSTPEAIWVTLPFPPTANLYWRSIVIKGSARVLLSKEGRAFKKACADRMKLVRRPPLSGPVRIRAIVFFPTRAGDLDNRIKPTLDGLRKGAFDDDIQVQEIHFRRDIDRKNPRVELVVAPIRPGEDDPRSQISIEEVLV